MTTLLVIDNPTPAARPFPPCRNSFVAGDSTDNKAKANSLDDPGPNVERMDILGIGSK